MNSADMVTKFSLDDSKGPIKVSDFLKALNDYCGHLAQDRPFSMGMRNRDAVIPSKYWNLIAFAVEGKSEGYYIHVGVLSRWDDKDHCQYTDLGVAKTYSSESAYEMAREASRFLAAAAWN